MNRMQDGFLNLAKPAGMTSHDCVAKVRWLLKQELKRVGQQAAIAPALPVPPPPPGSPLPDRQPPNPSPPHPRAKVKVPKVGHGGTLDPAAIGVLPIAIGRATRLLQYLPGVKAYRGTVRFGLTTATDDLEGQILTQQAVPQLCLEQVLPLLEQFKGTIEQIPPQYSAIQVEGKRLYDLARKEQFVDVPSRPVEIYQLTVMEWRDGEFPELVLEIHCGAGTYIRSIARDLGQILGVGATLAALTRTQSAGLVLADSLDFDTIATQIQHQTLTLLPPAALLAHLPLLHLQPPQAQDWTQGKRLAWDAVAAHLTLAPDTPLRIETETGQFLGVGTYRLGDYGPCLQPKVVWESAL